MPTPSVFRPVEPGNYRITPFRVFKEYTVTNTTWNLSGSDGYSLHFATHRNEKTPIGKTTLTSYGQNYGLSGTELTIPTRADNDPQDNFDGAYENVIWFSLNHKYYKHPYDASKTIGSYNYSDRRRIEKFLFLSASSFTIPYNRVGESIKPGSVLVNDITNNFILKDDYQGNLRDHAINSSSFASSSNLIGYWGFNNEFRHFKYHQPDLRKLEKGKLEFETNVFENDIHSVIKNVTYNTGILTTGKTADGDHSLATGSGVQAKFNGDGYIKTDAYKPINFDNEDDFSISFWYTPNAVSQSITTTTANSLITKRGVQDTLILNRNTRKREVIEENVTRTRYPFDIEVLNQTAGPTEVGKIRFRRSDGVTTFSSASNVQCTGSQVHILAQKNNNLIELYIDGVRQFRSTDIISGEVKQSSKLMFGALNTNFENALEGSLDEIRIYNYALNQSVINSLANNHYVSSSAYQTSTAGNIFYKNGQLTISSNLPKYYKALKNNWHIDYKGTHTIIENEVMVEVPAGTCNITMNPTALKRPNSDLLKTEFSGSLRPYVTTIGLYNDNAELLAVAKLAEPVAKRDDVDMNFMVRWDY